MKISKRSIHRLVLIASATLAVIFYQNCSGELETIATTDLSSLTPDPGEGDPANPAPPPGHGPEPAPPPALSVPANWSQQKAKLIAPSDCLIQKIGAYDFLNFDAFQKESCLKHLQVNFLHGKNYEFVTPIPEVIRANSETFPIGGSQAKNFIRLKFLPVGANHLQHSGLSLKVYVQGFYVSASDPLQSTLAPEVAANERIDFDLSLEQTVPIIEYSDAYIGTAFKPGKFIKVRLEVEGDPNRFIIGNQNFSVMHVKNVPPCTSNIRAPYIFGKYSPLVEVNPLRLRSNNFNGPAIYSTKIPFDSAGGAYFYSPLCYDSSRTINNVYNVTTSDAVVYMGNPPATPFTVNSTGGVYLQLNNLSY